MAYIDYESGEGLDPRVQRRLDDWKVEWAKLDNVLRIHGANPPALDGHIDLYQAVLHEKSPLSRLQRELIGVVVSAANRCYY